MISNPSTYRRVSFSQQGEDLVLFRVLRTRCNLPLTYVGFDVDLGAHHPVKDSTTKLLYDRGWSGVNVDIQEAGIDAFQAERTRDVSVVAAVNDCDGKLDVYVPTEGISVHASSDPEISQTLVRRGITMHKIQVPAYSFDSIMAHCPKVERVDYINIDVEGAELKALQGIDYERRRPRCISVEIHARNITTALQSEVALFLNAKGFECVASTVITYFFVDPQQRY